MLKNFPKVSIIITTKNEERNISRCLDSVIAQTWPEIEIIVVDNSSDDQTVSICQKYGVSIFTYGPERSAQRNYGLLEVATGFYSIYLDADMILSQTLIEECVYKMRSSEIIALHIPEVVLGTNFFSRARSFERSFYDGTVIDGARFFRRDVLIRCGGFDADLFAKGSGEDWDIDKKIKLIGCIGLLNSYSTKQLPQNWSLAQYIDSNLLNVNHQFVGIYHDESQFDLDHYLKKKKYYGLGFSGYIKKWGKNDPDIIKQFGLSYRYIFVFIENGKWKKIISNPLLTLGMYYLRLLVGYSYVKSKFMERMTNE